MKFHLIQPGMIGRKTDIEKGMAGQDKELYQRYLEEIRGYGGPSQSESLSERDVQRANPVAYQLVLDTFGNNDRVVRSRELQRGLDRGLCTSPGRVHGQAARQLDELRFRGFEQIHRGESLAEIIDCKTDSRAAVRREHEAKPIEVADALVLADLENEAIR